MVKRRKRSELSRAQCFSAFEEFACRVQRFGETSDASMFGPDLPAKQINVQFAVTGNFGSSDLLFEAIRVLAGHKLPRAAVGKSEVQK